MVILQYTQGTMADKVGLNGESIAHLDEDSFIKPDAKYMENWYDFLN